MKAIGVAAIALAAGAMLGAAANAGVAQGARPKGYMIAQLTVVDAAAYGKYAPKVSPVLAKYGGRYVVRGGTITPLEETPPGQRVVVIEFADVEAAKTFYNSPEYHALKPMRQAAASGPAYIIEGVTL